MGNKLCTFEGCGKALKGRGLCGGHYQQAKAGKTLTPLSERSTRPRISGSQEDFFWSRVERSPNCWAWTGARNNYGYGSLKYKGTRTGAHRFSFELANGPIPEGGIIDHLCHNPNCVNPEHLRLATHAQNMQNIQGAHAHSKSGIRGVHWDASRKRWRMTISANKTVIRKDFLTPEEAERAVIALRKELHK